MKKLYVINILVCLILFLFLYKVSVINNMVINNHDQLTKEIQTIQEHLDKIEIDAHNDSKESTTINDTDKDIEKVSPLSLITDSILSVSSTFIKINEIVLEDSTARIELNKFNIKNASSVSDIELVFRDKPVTITVNIKDTIFSIINKSTSKGKHEIVSFEEFMRTYNEGYKLYNGLSTVF